MIITLPFRTCCHNIILGSLWLDHYGDLILNNHTTGDRCVLRFHKAGYFGAGRCAITGEVMDKDGNVKYVYNDESFEEGDEHVLTHVKD